MYSSPDCITLRTSKTVAPSIGAIGSLAKDTANLRIKGFLEPVFQDVDAARERVEEMLGAQFPEVWTGGAVRDHIWRTSVRALIAQELPAVASPHDSGHTLRLEATLAVGVKGIGSIAYFGANGGERLPSALELRQESEHLQAMHRRYSQTAGPVDDVTVPRDAFVERLRFADDGDVEQLLDIYRRCFSAYLVDFTPQIIAASIASNIYIVARDICGRIVASAVGEIADVGDLRIMEISEIASHPQLRVPGAATACTRTVAAAARREGVDVVFSEARTNWDAIICVEYAAGLRVRGYMPRHCRIASPLTSIPQATEYGNLHVMQLL